MVFPTRESPLLGSQWSPSYRCEVQRIISQLVIVHMAFRMTDEARRSFWVCIIHFYFWMVYIFVCNQFVQFKMVLRMIFNFFIRPCRIPCSFGSHKNEQVLTPLFTMFILHSKSLLRTELLKQVREGLTKITLIHILWIRFLPPPLIHVVGFYNNIIKY